MAIKLNSYTRSSIVDLINTNFDRLHVYSGSPPASSDDGESGTRLTTITGINWSSAAGGTAGLVSPPYYGNDEDVGTAGYARLAEGMAVYKIQGSVGTAATCDFVISKEIFDGGMGSVTLTEATIVQPESA